MSSGRTSGPLMYGTSDMECQPWVVPLGCLSTMLPYGRKGHCSEPFQDFKLQYTLRLGFRDQSSDEPVLSLMEGCYKILNSISVWKVIQEHQVPEASQSPLHWTFRLLADFHSFGNPPYTPLQLRRSGYVLGNRADKGHVCWQQY